MKKKMVHYLPHELIIPILLRLPVKSLLRFKSVSKSWFSLISDPHFAISHFDLAAAASSTHHHHNRLVYFPLSTYASQTRSIDFDSSSLYNDAATASPDVSFLPPLSYPEIKGSCRGFLLLCFSTNLCLWNPSTGAIKLLSLSSIASSDLDIHFFTFFFGFGYDPSTDDYLVVLADLESCFELFSLRANAWNKIEATNLPYINASHVTRTGTLFNGIIHWLAFRRDVSVNVILAFDFVERSFSEVPLPSDFNPEFTFCDLCVLGRFLSLYVTGDNATEIWVMQEYKVQSSWTKSIVVATDDLPWQKFSPICTTGSGDIVGLDGKTGLVKCNAQGQLLEHRSYCVDRHGCQAVAYTESLLQLPVDSGQAANDDPPNDEA
ncbi:hypothetical protein RIF29_08135 [Crotalaria pallida]|uniref:F-box domain-containing protein n=1 Tax=Crotalaria pallida TaxID=3830 RepID=A0AAN9J5B2_CROPI